ncbi:VOC family protein [Palleronia marisminoris]|uniref:VOC family protein n=1 Tax=Palleronia marisminoris TaxID=315423 RepID=UPI000B89DD56|nr:VOC family protein [Palleronia marisminoris]
MPRERVTLITLGVRDMDRAKAFYRDWGWRLHPSSQGGLTVYQMNGAALALFELEALAEDQSVAVETLGTGASTLAQNCADRAEVDTVCRAAVAAGATLLKEPEEVFWGGYSGYVADPDGHVWEIAHNPFWPLNDDGSLTLPDEAG